MRRVEANTDLRQLHILIQYHQVKHIETDKGVLFGTIEEV